MQDDAGGPSDKTFAKRDLVSSSDRLPEIHTARKQPRFMYTYLPICHSMVLVGFFSVLGRPMDGIGLFGSAIDITYRDRQSTSSSYPRLPEAWLVYTQDQPTHRQDQPSVYHLGTLGVTSQERGRTTMTTTPAQPPLHLGYPHAPGICIPNDGAVCGGIMTYWMRIPFHKRRQRQHIAQRYVLSMITPYLLCRS